MKAKDFDYMSLLLLEIVGLVLNIRDEGVKD